MVAFVRDSKGIWRAEALLGLDWLHHGFGTRASEGWAPPERTVTLRQVHSATVWKANEPAGCLGEGDALVTDRAGVTLAIRTADCMPLLLADPHGRTVAAVHAGWRGTASGIAAAAVERMRREFGARPADIHAAIGPGIARCCYEVGEEVIRRLQKYLGQRTPAAPAKVDLAEVNRQQLEECGLDPARIHVARLCTHCRADDFHSFRRDKEHAGRMVSAIGIRG